MWALDGGNCTCCEQAWIETIRRIWLSEMDEDQGRWLRLYYGGLYILSVLYHKLKTWLLSGVTHLVLTGMHENENTLKAIHTLLTLRCWVWRSYGVETEKNRYLFLAGYMITPSWERVVWNESGSWTAVESNLLWMSNPYSNTIYGKK